MHELININIIEMIIFIITLIYGIGFGIKNTLVRILVFILKFGPKEFIRTMSKQSTLGRTLDATFIVSIMYFSTFGRPFIETILKGL
jgi:hypothetical protein